MKFLCAILNELAFSSSLSDAILELNLNSDKAQAAVCFKRVKADQPTLHMIAGTRIPSSTELKQIFLPIKA